MCFIKVFNFINLFVWEGGILAILSKNAFSPTLMLDNIHKIVCDQEMFTGIGVRWWYCPCSLDKQYNVDN